MWYISVFRYANKHSQTKFCNINIKDSLRNTDIHVKNTLSTFQWFYLLYRVYDAQVWFRKKNTNIDQALHFSCWDILSGGGLDESSPKKTQILRTPACFWTSAQKHLSKLHRHLFTGLPRKSISSTYIFYH